MDHSQHLTHSHEPWLVVLSVAMAILASYIALELGSRVALARGRDRYPWLVGGALIMGLGIWSMHFIAMLAFRLPLEVRYDIGLTALSAVIAMLASGLALWIVSREKVRWWQFVLGGGVMGVAIAGMHYTGMAALRLRANLTYDPTLFALSVVIAIVASMAALWLITRFRIAVTRAARIGKAVSAVVMGIAIAGMHYTGMAAAIFTERSTFSADLTGSIEISLIGTIAVMLAALVLLVGGFVLFRNIRNLPFAGKFLAFAVIFTLPLVLVTTIFVQEQVDNINKYGYNEKYGTQYLRPLHRVLVNVIVYQWLTVERGEVGSSAVINTQQQIDESFAQLAEVDFAYGTILQSTRNFAELRTEWETLRDSITNMDVPRRKAQLDLFVQHIRAHISLIGNTSSLILDPDIDTYYLMSSVLLTLPEQQLAIARFLSLNSEFVRTQGLTADEQIAMNVLASDLTNRQLTLRSEATVSASGVSELDAVDEDAYQALDAALDKMENGIQRANTMLQFRSASIASFSFSPEEFEAMATRLREDHAAYYDLISVALERGIDDRINRETNQLWLQIGAVVMAFVLAVIVGVILVRAVTQPIAQLTFATRQLAAGTLTSRVMVTGTDETSQLGSAFNAMAQSLQETQQEVDRRTRALEASTEVTRRLSTILDEEELVRAVVTELQAAFNYYHAHIYVFDDAQENLLMRGGTGEAGQILLERGHKIPRGRGLVGRAADTKAPVLVSNTAQDAGWLPNPLLPETRSELAVPILLGETALGVIDVQQNRVDGLKALDVELIQSVAGQVAIALQNARSFALTRRQAEQDAFVNTLGQKIQQAARIEDILQIAVQELGQTLKARRAKINIGLKLEGNGSNGHEVMQ